MWSTLNEIMNKRTRKNNLLPKKFAGNNSEEMITNSHEIADKFNEYFTNIRPGIAKKLPNIIAIELSMNTSLIRVKTVFLFNQSLSLMWKLK